MMNDQKIIREMLQEQFDFVEEVVQWLWINRKDLSKQDYFDFPDYCGMPKHLSNKLSSQTVDRIQDHFDSFKNIRSPRTIIAWLVDF